MSRTFGTHDPADAGLGPDWRVHRLLGTLPYEAGCHLAQDTCDLSLFGASPARQEKDALPGDAPNFGRLGVPFFSSKAASRQLDTCSSMRSTRLSTDISWNGGAALGL